MVGVIDKWSLFGSQVWLNIYFEKFSFVYKESHFCYTEFEAQNFLPVKGNNDDKYKNDNKHLTHSEST